jgi:hypothetical protein
MRGCQRKAALARWQRWRAFQTAASVAPGRLIGPVKADTRHGYVMVKAAGMGYYLTNQFSSNPSYSRTGVS